MEWACTYTKTHSGFCEQQKAVGSSNCYYHEKVEAGLIQTDEERVINDMPSIVT